jgi:hypothetical protein
MSARPDLSESKAGLNKRKFLKNTGFDKLSLTTLNLNIKPYCKRSRILFAADSQI